MPESEKAEIDRLLSRPATKAFDDWLPEVSPRWQWDWRYLVKIRTALKDVTDGSCKRLMIFCPPRHGKSEQTTIRYPVWRLERNAETRVCVGCYNQRFAERFGRRSRRLAETRGIVGQDRKAAAEWETPAGGVYRSCGVGSPPMGEGFDLIIIDDPVKSREEAESEAYRDRAWEWYQDIYTRREPGAAIVLIQTRWHEDDLAGRLLADPAEQWRTVILPAIAEENDPIERAPGEALCPDRFPRSELDQTRRVLGSYVFEALYQQRPTAREGNLFKVANLEIADAAPAGLRKCRAWDLAATADGGDYTAGVLLGTNDAGRFWVLDVARGRWGPDERNAQMRQTAKSDGSTVTVRLAQDPGQAGKEQTKQLTGMLAGYAVESLRVTGEKQTRADPFASQVNAGNVSIVRAEWNRALIEELRQFPSGKHDDQVDAASDAFSVLVGAPAADYASGYAFTPQSNPHAVTQQPSRVQVRSGGGYAF